MHRGQQTERERKGAAPRMAIGTTDPQDGLRGEEGPTVFPLKSKNFPAFRYAGPIPGPKKEGWP